VIQLVVKLLVVSGTRPIWPPSPVLKYRSPTVQPPFVLRAHARLISPVILLMVVQLVVASLVRT